MSEAKLDTVARSRQHLTMPSAAVVLVGALMIGGDLVA